MISEAEVRQIIGVEGARRLVEIVQGAWQDHLDEGRRRSSRTRAAIVWEKMITRADDEETGLIGMDGVRRRKLIGSVGYAIQERILLRFKKHDRGLEAKNYPTPLQQRLNNWGFLDGMPELDHVTCGYVLDAAEAEVQQVVLVRNVKRAVEWFIDLRELASGSLAPVKPILPSLLGSNAEEIAALPSIARVARKEDGDGR